MFTANWFAVSSDEVAELSELTGIDVKRGLVPFLAKQVAEKN